MLSMYQENKTRDSLLLGGVALGVVAGAAVATYLWWQKVRAIEILSVSPLERAEQLISSCEDKLDSIERAVSELKAAR